MDKVKIGDNIFPYPMPVTIIGTMSDGKIDFSTVSWVNRVNSSPPIWSISISKSHRTYIGIRENRSFSINFPSVDMIEKTDYCGLVSGEITDKSNIFQVFFGELDTAPMIKECPLSLECKLMDIMELRTNILILGRVVAGYSEARYITDGKPDIKKINPIILTMPDNNYWSIGEHMGNAWEVGRKYVMRE